MARFSFRTLFNDQTYGTGFFEYPDALGTGAGTNVYQDSVTAFGYNDSDVGSFDRSNLNNFQFSIGTTPTTSAFNIVMSTADRLKSVTAGPAQPGLLGPTAGKPIKLEWPTQASAVPAQPANNLPADNSAEQPTYAMGLIPIQPQMIIDTPTQNPPVAVDPVITSPVILAPPVMPIPAPYDSCIQDCFTQMGRETRCFVLTTIKGEINNLINNSNFDLSKLTLILNEIRDSLDGDDGSEGMQAYLKLITDIKFLMDNRLTQENVTNIVNNMKFGNNTINYLINNEAFINGIANNQHILATFVNNSITKIIGYLTNDSSTDADLRNQFIAALNQLIIQQISQVKQEINTSINFMRDDLNNKIQQINIEIGIINNNLKGNSGSYINKFELNNLQIQIDALKDKINSGGSLEINANTDLSRNVTVISILAQISQINNSIAAIKVNLQQYMTRNDFAYACETACNAFLTALRNPAPCEPVKPEVPKVPEKEVVEPPKTPIKVKEGASIKGDPHFIGAEGDKYDVQGEAGKTYNLLSDDGIQVNGTFGEWNVDGQGTIVNEIGITHNNDFIKIGLQGALEINDKPVTADGVHLNGVITKAGSTITFKEEEYELLITDNQVQGHHYLNIEFKSENVVADGVLPHGLWGQTADGDNKTRDGDKGHYAQGGGAIENADGTITQAGDKAAIKSYEVSGLKDTSFGAHNKFSAKKTPKKSK
jgi:hypothetical protein